jgi:tRNA pseudouridine synthase 10
VVVNSLQVVTKEDIKKLKEGEEEKRKRYTALCVTAEPCTDNMFCKLEQMTELTLQQETPIRVLHRRSNAIREKVVHNMKVEREGLKDNIFKLLVSTSAGTYVKEFVHRDFSRTVPNVGSLLGCRADILALDVEEVELAWPPGGKGASA